MNLIKRNPFLTVLLVVVFTGSVAAFYYLQNDAAQDTDSSEPVSIEDQELYDPVKNENPAYSLPDTPTVTTSSGAEIQLELLFEIPPADKGIYRYQNQLYSYDMNAHTFAYLSGSDAASFEIVPGTFSFNLYAKDRSNVYCRGEILAGADPETFEEIPDWNENRDLYRTPDGRDYIYYQDANHRYVFGECSPTTAENWEWFESGYDLPFTFLYPPTWKLSVSRTPTYAAIVDHLYSDPDNDTDEWIRARENCESASSLKYGKPECYRYYLHIETDGKTRGILSITGRDYIPPPTGGSSLNTSAEYWLDKGCSSENSCEYTPNKNRISVQRHYGKWNIGENSDYFVYVIPPAPTDEVTEGYVLSMEDFSEELSDYYDVFESMKFSFTYLE